MLRYGLASLRRHSFRLILTAIAIVVGVTFVTGTLVLSDSLNRAYTASVDDAYSGVSVEVSGPILTGQTNSFNDILRAPVSTSLVATIDRVPGVGSAAGEVNRRIVVIGSNGTPIINHAPTFGISWVDDNALNPYPLTSGRAPTHAGDVVIDSETAKLEGWHIGDRIGVIANGGATQHFTIVGICQPGAAGALGNTLIVAWDLSEAQQLFTIPGQVDSIAVAAQPGVADTSLRSRVARVLPSGVTAVTGSDAARESLQQVEQDLGFLTDALLVFAAIAFFMGSFTIVNTFAILVSVRTRELALLRVLAATRRQLFALVIAEALVTGVLASAVGVGCGQLLATLLLHLLAPTGSAPVAAVLSPATAMLALFGGTAVTTLSAAVPARRASRLAPLAAFRVADPELDRFPRWRAALGIALVVMALAGLTLGRTASDQGSIGWTIVGALALLLAVPCIGPLLLSPLVRLVTPSARRLGVASRLARENPMRNRNQTSSTTSALLIGVALVSCTLVLGSSITASVGAAVAASDRATFLVLATGGDSYFSPNAAQIVERDPRLVDVAEVAVATIFVGGRKYAVGAIDPLVAQRDIQFTAVEGSASDFDTGSILIDATTSADNDWHPGSVVEITFPDGRTVPQRVAAVYQDNRVVGSYVLSLATTREYDPSLLDVAILANNAPNVTEAAALSALRHDLRSYPTLTPGTENEFVDQRSQQINSFLLVITALLSVAVIVALIGVVNTLMLAVFERTREIGLLRALGMLRGQVRMMVAWEAVAVAVVATSTGVVVGAALAWAAVGALAGQGLGTFALPWGQLVVVLAAAPVAGVSASLLPARRAARLRILDAIALE